MTARSTFFSAFFGTDGALLGRFRALLALALFIYPLDFDSMDGKK